MLIFLNESLSLKKSHLSINSLIQVVYLYNYRESSQQ